jgi:hypothetical protein
MEHWSEKEVCEWLRSVVGDDIAEDFLSREIEGASLSQLSEADMKELGLSTPEIALLSQAIQRELEDPGSGAKHESAGPTGSKAKKKRRAFKSADPDGVSVPTGTDTPQTAPTPMPNTDVAKAAEQAPKPQAQAHSGPSPVSQAPIVEVISKGNDKPISADTTAAPKERPPRPAAPPAKPARPPPPKIGASSSKTSVPPPAEPSPVRAATVSSKEDVKTKAAAVSKPGPSASTKSEPSKTTKPKFEISIVSARPMGEIDFKSDIPPPLSAPPPVAAPALTSPKAPTASAIVPAIDRTKSSAPAKPPRKSAPAKPAKHTSDDDDSTDLSTSDSSDGEGYDVSKDALARSDSPEHLSSTHSSHHPSHKVGLLVHT